MALLAAGCAGPQEPPPRVPPPEPGGELLPMDWEEGGDDAKAAAKAPAPAPAPAPRPAPPPAPGRTESVPTLPGPAAGGEESRGPAPVGLVRSANDAIRRGQHEVAIRTAKQALRRDEKYVPAMVVLAKGYYYLRKYELAGAILDIAAGIDGNQADVHQLRGFIELALHNQPGAIASWKKATDLDPNHASAWNNLGVQYVQAKNYRDAVPALEKAVALAPDSPSAHLNLGSAYRGAGEYQKAEASYRRALEIRRDYPEAYFNLGILYLDAPEFPGLDPLAKLNAAILQFTRYKEHQSYRLAKDDPVDGYLEEARKGIERERKRVDRERHRAEPAPDPKEKTQ